jgi:PhnB protein
MTHATPFLLFEGNCAEAMEFYRSCLGGDLTITRLRDTPMKQDLPAALMDKVVHAVLQSGDVVLTATDWMHQTRVPKRGNLTGIYLTGGTYTDLRPVFDKLTSGADPALLDDLRDMPFGVYGHLVDRYGVQWFFRGDGTVPAPESIRRSPRDSGPPPLDA